MSKLKIFFTVMLAIMIALPCTVWAAQFDGTLDDVFSIQEQIARKIVDALEIHLTPEQKRSLSRRWPSLKALRRG